MNEEKDTAVGQLDKGGTIGLMTGAAFRLDGHVYAIRFTEEVSMLAAGMEWQQQGHDVARSTVPTREHDEFRERWIKRSADCAVQVRGLNRPADVKLDKRLGALDGLLSAIFNGPPKAKPPAEDEPPVDSSSN